MASDTMHEPGTAQLSPIVSGRPRRKTSWRRLLVIAAGTYLLWCVGLYFCQDRLLYRRDMVRELDADETRWLESAQVIACKLSSGGEVQGYLFLAPGASAERPAPLVVFLHGNAESVGQQGWTVGQYRELGCSVLLPEYRGYAGAAGTPSQAGIVADAVAFLDDALKRPDVDRSRLVIHGRSLGGGVAAQLAAQRKPAAFILESSFTSIASMAHQYVAPEWLVSSPYHTDDVLPTLDMPVLIFHGSQDHVVPFEHARRNHQLAKGSTLIEYDCDHNLPGPAFADAYWKEIRSFLERSIPAKK